MKWLFIWNFFHKYSLITNDQAEETAELLNDLYPIIINNFRDLCSNWEVTGNRLQVVAMGQH